MHDRTPESSSREGRAARAVAADAAFLARAGEIGVPTGVAQFEIVSSIHFQKQNEAMFHSLALDPDFFDLLADSHLRLTGTPLVDPAVPRADGPRWLYEDAPFCVLAHDTAEDPRYIYANRTVQRCFEYDWDEMTALHSRYSAEEPNRDERARLLEAVRAHGFATGYRGLRVAKSGRRFWIEDVTVWNLIDRDGAYRGQAATYRRWTDA
ncbi:MEKHLA domain-containing protein [Burkholderia thailandensis]|nr:MEKHLA domain-containing protein [Burkholderia thailandensis]MCS3391651.1 MEKHLA domain-containing protein [Burkholderia thailandensis]MCS6424960.1 MEKHLA domain-containing protein [Burkholderia thailandensis]MCS6452692.1 MEKHLA domain-containing protein [Burkholderia thailandensis]MCS6464387.1 MEKHLA domain-containing protein [Burkholderia thailandensis]MCS6482128.1 MEKHLA domain-containing protein [Burkholderia thailandensis]